jgi:hypothetical protein
MRGVVEERQPRPNGILEIEDVEARRRLVEAIPIAPRIDAEEAAEDQPDGGFV